MKLFEDGDPCFAPMLNALFAAFRGTAVMSGCEASATGTSRTVSITAGSVQINGEVIAVSAGSVTLDAGSTFDRYDLVSVNASGSKIVTKGTTKRKCPTQPANTCLLAIVFVPAGATVIATGDVYDARMLASHVVAGQLTLAAGLVSSGKTILNSSGEFAGGGAAYVLYADPTCAAANLCNQVLGEYSRGDESYGKMVELSPIPSSVPIPNVKHTVTVQWQTRIYYGAPYTGYTRVYINGSPVGVEKTTSSTGYTTVSETIEVEPGDIISIWGHSTWPSEYSLGTVYVRNVKLFAFAVPAGRPQMW